MAPLVGHQATPLHRLGRRRLLRVALADTGGTAVAAAQDDDARPAVANPLPDIGQYDVVLLGSPIWNVRAPMIMSTFTESHDFTGKAVHPFTTHAMSGLGTTQRDYSESCPGAAIGAGLAIRGERAQDARHELSEWLRRIELNLRH